MKSQHQIEIIDRIRRLRHERSCSQGGLAAMLGISRGQIGSIESCRDPHKYTLGQIHMICREFNYRIEHLFLSEADLENGNDIIDALISKITEYEK